MSISASEWVARSEVDLAVFSRWPQYEVVLLAADHVDPATLAAVTAELFDAAHAEARAASADDVHPHVAAWHDAYRDFGVKPRVGRPSVDALLRRARSENGLPRITTLVDLYNAISMLEVVPIGGEDLQTYSGPARLVLATGAEPFLTTADGQPVVDHAEPGEPVWIDGEGVTCRRWNWRQTSRTAITHDTRSAAFIIDSLDAPQHAGAHRAAARLAALIPDLHLRTISAPKG
jgi:DNA/RNA-binding domain of Phe-tRNA-synthetase-like protein